MEFDADWIAVLNMFQGTNIMVVAQIFGIQIENWIDSEWNPTTWLKDAILKWDRAKIIELIEKTNFLWQIIKPLEDYADIYTLCDASWNEYEYKEVAKNWKIEKKYNRNIIKADLLLWKTIQFKDWNDVVLKYNYNESSAESQVAEWNSIYEDSDVIRDENWKITIESTIDIMLWVSLEARNQLQANDTIETLWQIKQLTEEIINKIKNNEDISEEIEKLEEKLLIVKRWLSANSSKFTSEFVSFQEKYSSLWDLPDYANKIYWNIWKIMEELWKDANELAWYILLD